MPTYGEFAGIYAEGTYPEFSRRMAELLPPVLEALDARPRNILDIACGEGTFVTAVAAKGLRITGIDRSPQMLGIAGRRARQTSVDADFVQGDMRALPFRNHFDLATCWFDSLNYLLNQEDLERTFRGVARALTNGGLFIFDMNTIHGLAVTWREYPCYVEREREDTFEIHRRDYDFETGVATLKITGFVRRGQTWKRIDEVHKERGYRQEEIHAILREAAFEVLASWGSIRDRSEPTAESDRIWYVAKKGAGAGAA